MQPWSYSVLSLYETCPKKFYHQRILKDVKDTGGAAAEHGKKIHQTLEAYMRDGGTLPIDLQHHKERLDTLRALNGERVYEQQMAVNANLKPTGWFDEDVFCRAIIDYGVIGKTNAYICDWKTGKPHEDMTQLKLMAAMLFSFRPELQAVAAEFYWLQRKTASNVLVKKEDVANIWAELIARAKPVMKIRPAEEYEPKPSGLCRKYCAVTSCPYHGV